MTAVASLIGRRRCAEPGGNADGRVLLARMQFAANITFHILFPTISIALGWVLLFFRLSTLRATDRGRSGGSTPTASGPRCSR